MRIAVAGRRDAGPGLATLLSVDPSTESPALVRECLDQRKPGLRAALDTNASPRAAARPIVHEIRPLRRPHLLPPDPQNRPVIAPVSALNSQSSILIRSMRPGGFTSAQADPGGYQIAFPPEFAREDVALHSSRIPLSERSGRGRRIADVQRENFTHDLFGSA